jgi:hypothetical protein
MFIQGDAWLFDFLYNYFIRKVYFYFFFVFRLKVTINLIDTLTLSTQLKPNEWYQMTIALQAHNLKVYLNGALEISHKTNFKIPNRFCAKAVETTGKFQQPLYFVKRSLILVKNNLL